jgi:hypothetical protein
MGNHNGSSRQLWRVRPRAKAIPSRHQTRCTLWHESTTDWYRDVGKDYYVKDVDGNGNVNVRLAYDELGHEED